ncbi:MFS transporter [Cohnella mopanensis]|uniref:MFS transporter n=1 Tax=Cohnella mopanensis TaxID=2911966 RepID=UPI001EF86073|nr:MFS transporter [Cohnella mopanensis]
MFNTQWRKLVPGSMLPAALLLFVAEWLRGAYLISFLPYYSVQHANAAAAFVGLAVSAHYLADSAIKTFAGYLLDRYSPKMVLQVGFALTVCGLVLSLSTGFGWMTVLSSGIMGIGLSPIWLVGVRHVKEENRAERMGILYAFWMAGLGLGPVMLNLVLDGGLGIGIIALSAFLTTGWLIVCLCRFPLEHVAKLGRVSAMEQLKLMRENLKNNRIIVPAILLQTMGAGIIVPFLSSFASQRLALTNSELSLVMVLGGACVVLLLVPMGKWYDSSKSRWFLVCGFGLFAVSLAGLTTVSSLTGATMMAVVMGFAYAMLLPAWNALLSRHVPAQSPSMGWGILSSLEGMGVVVGPLIGSWAVAKGSLASPFLLCACLYGIVGLSYFLMPAELFGKRSSVEIGKA